MSMRMFVAVQPPLEVLEDLAEYLEPRRERDSPLRWSAMEQWHLTLAFLPSVVERNVDDLVERLTAAAGRRKRFELTLSGAGAFPNPAAAKVLWGGVTGDTDELGRLATNVRAGAGKAGVEVEGGPFRPHLTLARLAQPLDVTRWLRVLDLYSGPSWRVDEVILFQSYLGQGPRGRARHDIVETFELENRSELS
jgi:2'-5' RNA ligase